MTIQETNICLPIDYEPTEHDILSGRGRTLNNHTGNMQFIEIIKSNLQQYMDAPRRMHKSFVIEQIVATMLASGHRFIKKHPTKITNQWYVMNQEESYKRVGHALRDLKYKNSNNNSGHSKLALRKNKQRQRREKITSHDSFENFPEKITSHHSFESFPERTRYTSDSYVSCSSDEDGDRVDDLSTTYSTSSHSEFDDNIDTICSSSSIFVTTGRSSIRIDGCLRQSSLCLSYLDLSKEDGMVNFKF